MSTKRRANFSAKEKVAILRERLIEGKPISEVCEAHGIQPKQYYEWQQRFFENGEAAFKGDEARETRQLKGKVSELESRLAQKDGVIAELSQEYIQLKKSRGGR